MKKKALIAAILAATTLSATTAFAAKNPFNDVPADHWSYDALAMLAKDGVIEGYVHYSDFWADPGKQWAPKAWEKDDAKKVQRDVYDYTKKVLGDFKAAGALPEMVQVGNEITNGMIWPLGKLPSADNGKTLASFVESGLKAVHDTDAGIKTMIHIAIQDQPAVHGAQGRQVYARCLDAGRRPVEVQALCGDRRRGADGRYPGYEVE